MNISRLRYIPCVILIMLVIMTISICVSLHPSPQPYIVVGRGATEHHPSDFPRVIHAIYIPWDKNTQRLKDDQYDFDHTWINQTSAKYPTWQVKLWSMCMIKQLIINSYSQELWVFLMKRIVRPTQLVDFARFMIVYIEGGVYMQYGFIVNDIEQVIPLRSSTRLFTENVIHPTKTLTSNRLPHRNGAFEHHIRIGNQLFGAYPNSRFIREVLLTSLFNMATITVTCDYSVLYVGANALLSRLYHTSNFSDHELISLRATRHIINKIMCNGSWRGKVCAWHNTPPTPTIQGFNMSDAERLMTAKS
jgi:hypothetical protein